MDNQKIIEQAINSGNIEDFNDAVQKVALTKLAGLALDEDVRLDIRPLVKNFTVPVRIEQKVKISQTETGDKKTIAIDGTVGIIILIIALWLMMLIGWWSFPICAVLIVCYLAYKNKKTNDPVPLSYEVETVIKASVREVMQEIDSFIDIVRVVNKAPDKPIDSQQLPSLYDAYPNVVKWLQNLYTSQYEFDENGRKYLFKHIPRLLGQHYYEVVMYDGNNIALFDIDRDSDVNGTEVIYPAIVDTRTNKIILKGRVCNP